MSAKLARLEYLTGHSFSDPKLLERAVTHRSWAFENMPGAADEDVRQTENESMEFLGDSVLGLAVAEELYDLHPKSTEGELTLMKHHLVSTATLAKAAEEFGLGQFVRVGKGEEKTGGRKKQALLANTFEAVIASIFLDAGYIPARHFVRRTLGTAIRNASPEASLDFKTTLQEVLQSAKLAAPRYNVINTEGPPHARTFSVEAVWEGGKAFGSGSSIKAAEMAAAAEALRLLRGSSEGLTKGRHGELRNKSSV